MNNVTGATSGVAQSPVAAGAANAEFQAQFMQGLLKSSGALGEMFRQGMGGAMGGMPLVGGLAGAGGMIAGTIGAMGSMGTIGSMGSSFAATSGGVGTMGNLENMSVSSMFMLIMAERQKVLKDVMVGQMKDYRYKANQIKQYHRLQESLRKMSRQLDPLIKASKMAESIPGIGGLIAKATSASLEQAKGKIDDQIEACKNRVTELSSEQNQDMMRMQDIMDKYKQAAEQATNAVKKYNDMMSQIINNWK